MVAVALLDGEAAADTGLIATLHGVVNQAYARGEGGLWREGAERMSHEGRTSSSPLANWRRRARTGASSAACA